MENIAEILEGVKTMGIGGHIRPDGDCVGSCMALYLYVKTYYPEIQADVYLDNPKPVFGHIDCMDEIKTELDGDKEYDLFVTCDVSARDRLAIAGPYFDTAKRTACIDHHISNHENFNRQQDANDSYAETDSAPYSTFITSAYINSMSE